MTPVEKELLREWQQVQIVFGEEIDRDSMWRDAEGNAVFAYSYDDVPEWATEDFNREGRYATGIVFGGGFLPSPPKTISAPDGTWELVATYASSGERECWGYGDEVTPDECDGGDQCVLCECPVGEDHGCVYIGEGYEAIYRFEET